MVSKKLSFSQVEFISADKASRTHYRTHIHLIETVEISFTALLVYDSGFLQKVFVDVAADRVAFKVEMNVHVLAETGRIVVAVRLGVAERLQDRIRLD